MVFTGDTGRRAWSQEKVAGSAVPPNQTLQNANESQVKDLWGKLQAESVALEATDPHAAVTRYQQFFEQGAHRFPSVGLQIALRIARIWQIDIGDYDKAIEIYDWALATYKNRPEIGLLQQARLSAEQAQKKTETAPQKKVVGVPSLTVPVPLAANGGKLGIGIPSSTSQAKLGIGLPSSSESKTLSVATPRVTGSGNALGWRPGVERCVTALVQQEDKKVWVATEDAGVWCCDLRSPMATRWKQFTAKDGLGDDSAYALALDQQGRVWAGTLNHGVSVWNGHEWRNYNVLGGPIGARVLDIAVCPSDGDVWIATNAGITRYSSKNDTWSHLTRTNGLPSDQVQSLAFDKVGNLVIGTQCDGVGLAQAKDNYKVWRIVQGPEQLPTSPSGEGLPSNLINDVLIARDSTIYVATTAGLAWSADGGESWAYVRGQDYAAKVKSSFTGPPKGWAQTQGALLSEDYVSCLAEDGAGRLLLGHWQTGDEALQVRREHATVALQRGKSHTGSGFVKAILSRSSDVPLLAMYDEGLRLGSNSKPSTPTSSVPSASRRPVAQVPPPLPTPAKAPTLAELNTLLASLGSIAPLDPKVPVVAELAEDWTTQGDWLGRYGRYWASLNAMISPGNYMWGAGWQGIDYAFQISPQEKNNSLRYWLHSQQTDNPRVLEMPPVYFDSRLQSGLATATEYRRQAEIDDNGENYPLTKEGPDIYFSLKVPRGLWTLSFYNHNKDGEEGQNRLRDYRYSIRNHDSAKPIANVTDFDAQLELVHSRQRDFRGGVYKRYLLRGPQQLTVKMAKNNSLNTILAGAFLDLVDEQPAPYFGTVASWQQRQRDRDQEREQLSTQDAAQRHRRFSPATDEKEAANRLFVEVERLREMNPSQWAYKSRPIYITLARWIESFIKTSGTLETPDLLSQQGTCFYHLMMYNEWENTQKKLGVTPARYIEKSLKWDSKNDFSGKGYQSVTSYLSTEKNTKPESKTD